MLQQITELIEMLNEEVDRCLVKGTVEQFTRLLELRNKAYELYSEQLKQNVEEA